jgi:hypothetical protein
MKESGLYIKVITLHVYLGLEECKKEFIIAKSAAICDEYFG